MLFIFFLLLSECFPDFVFHLIYLVSLETNSMNFSFRNAVHETHGEHYLSQEVSLNKTNESLGQGFLDFSPDMCPRNGEGGVDLFI